MLLNLSSCRGVKLMRDTSLRIVLFVSSIIALPGIAAPIATNTALPVSAQETIFREQIVFTRASDRVGGISRDVQIVESRTVLGHGLTPRLAVFGVLPLIDRESNFGNTRMNASGVGDAAVFARYELYRADKPGQTFRIVPYGGVRAPTGRTGRTGDGSWDLFGGLIATLASTKWVLDSQVRYDLNRQADGFERGNSFAVEASFQYRLAPDKITLQTKGFVFGVLELSANHYEHNRQAGVEDPNSGGFNLFLTPGLQYSTRRWIVDFGVKVPIVKDLNGTALEPDYTVLTSVRINF